MAAAVTAIFLSHASRAPLEQVERAQAVADAGLEGDRHSKPGRGRQVLLVEHEALDAFSLKPGDVREQVTVRGLDLYAAPDGAQLRIGTAVLEAQEVCAPCAYMDGVQAGLKDRIEGRRGRFFRVVTAGSFAVGDPVEVELSPKP